jgi:MtN3 and saliva related transmembrane protein
MTRNIIIFLIEAGFSLSLLANALLFIPQAVKLYRTKNITGLSLLTFAGFNVIQVFTVLHGYLQKDYLLILGYLLSLITCGACTWMIIAYRNKQPSNK